MFMRIFTEANHVSAFVLSYFKKKDYIWEQFLVSQQSLIYLKHVFMYIKRKHNPLLLLLLQVFFF